MPAAVTRLGIRPIDLLLLLISALSVIGYTIFAAVYDRAGFPLDDSWIHQVYARNLAQHGEWAYIPGQPSAASSGPLYTAALAIGQLVGLSPVLWAHILGVLALTVAGSVSVRLAERLFPTLKWVGPGTGLLIILSWHMIWAAASGMETIWFITFSLILIWRFWQEPTLSQTTRQQVLKNGMVIGFISGLCYLNRPEGLLLVGLGGLIVWACRIHPDFKTFAIWGVGVAIGAAILMIPYILINLSLIGEPLPSTVRAKIAYNAGFREDFIGTRIWKMGITMFAGAQLMWVPAMIVGIVAIARQKIALKWLYLLPILWGLTHFTVYLIVMPVYFHHGRYIMPVLPTLLLYAVGGTILIVEWGKNSAPKRVLTRTLALSAILAVLGFWWIGGKAYGEDVKLINTEMVKASKWVEINIPKEDLFAVHDIGALGYFAPREHVFDIAGLISPEVVPIITQPEETMQLMCEQGAKWMMVLTTQNPAEKDDPRIELVYITDSPYLKVVAGDNMKVYRLHFENGCGEN